MRNSVKVRKIIFEILNEIRQKNINFDESYLNFTKNVKVSDQDRSMIYNIALNSIRNNFFIQSILNKYLKKKTSNKIKVLLVCAITQILYLDFKDYAVTNDTVEIAKIKNLNPGLVNSLLKNIINNSKEINKKEINILSVPSWFIKRLNQNKININEVLENVSKEPSLHIVFKDKKFLDTFGESYISTTEVSAFIKEKKKIKELENYDKGYWWVQDFSSMLPIYLSPEFNSKKIIDICSAPGGKSFQVLSSQNEVYLNDISINRINILKRNLERLKFNVSVTNIDALSISENKNYDVVILDSPCSGIGTLRRNPEILYKKSQPNLDLLVDVQTSLINKATKLLNKKGVLLYMVCSFFYEETKAIKNKFLSENKNFSQHIFESNNKDFNKFIDTEGDIYCIPSDLNNFMIDGFYAVKFVKND